MEQKSTAILSLLGDDMQIKPSPVDRTFGVLSNGMHYSFWPKFHLEHYSTEASIWRHLFQG